MYGEPNTCKKCNHKCHCNETDCKECINDVCYDCQCELSHVGTFDIPESFLKD